MSPKLRYGLLICFLSGLLSIWTLIGTETRKEIIEVIKHPIESGMEFVLKWEGGFVNDPNDPGGPTNKGVTLKTAEGLGIDMDGDGDTDIDDIKKLDTATAVQIYKQNYWNALDMPEDIDTKLSIAAFDTAVNCGVSRARRWLRETLDRGQDYRYFLNLRTIYYLDLVKKRPNLAKFKNGWLNRVNDLKKYLDIIDPPDTPAGTSA